MTTLTDIHQYYKARIKEVQKYANSGDPWAFLMSAAYIDYLVKMVYNAEPSTNRYYKDFIRDYLSLINIQYRDFIYTNGLQDLPDQMYHVLRCGIVHGYSLVPDALSIRKGGRIRSILLAHNKNGAIHFTKYNQDGLDSVIFTAEEFAKDLESVLDEIFLNLAPTNTSLENNILEWVRKYPPIMGKFSL
ncbi:MAG: hypothetical protein H6577_24155 [Lewinellaceae bacterium]|nr:hypothetical protein [Saprospiraceae bacterium]MCB9341229.1 hypothetical protein [Lewinellaceae bacterium]